MAGPCGPSAPWWAGPCTRTSEPGRGSVPRRGAGGHQLLEPRAPGPTRCSASTNTCGAFRGDSTIEGLRAEIAQPAVRPLRPFEQRRLALVRGLGHDQRAPVPGAVVSIHMHHAAMTDAGLRSLAWLMSVQVSPGGHFAPIGSDGFYERGRNRQGSTSSRWKPARRSPPARRPASPRERRSGPTTRSAPSAGSWDRTTCGNGCTTAPPAVAAMACIATASTRTRAPKPPCRS